MKTFLVSILGFLVASAVSWGALGVWSVVYLDEGDIYWDRTPYAADLFTFMLVVLCARCRHCICLVKPSAKHLTRCPATKEAETVVTGI